MFQVKPSLLFIFILFQSVIKLVKFDLKMWEFNTHPR
jgi:hypothetical protein